jgi:phage-related minor tail protein
MNINEPLSLSGDGFKLIVAPEAAQLKAEIIARSASITRVSGPDENDTARASIKALAAMRNAVSKCRETIKKPVLEIGRKIDSAAKEFVGEIDAEEKRVTGLVAGYAAEVERERQRVLREMEAKRQAEEQARREQEETARAAEAARIAAEQAAWEASDDAQSAKAAEAAKQAEESRRAAEEAAKAAESKREMIAPPPAKAEGVKFEMDYEVTDVHALYRFRPAFVNLEARRADILAWLKTIDDLDSIPEPDECGIRITRRAKVSTR